MNRLCDQGCDTRIDRSTFARALKVEGLEDRKLLAADMQTACDMSATETVADVPVEEVSQLSTPNASLGLDDGMLNDLATAVAANVDSTSEVGRQIATLNVSLFNGQTFSLSLTQLPQGSFQLTFDNATNANAGIADVSTSDASLSTVVTNTFMPTDAQSTVNGALDGSISSSDVAPWIGPSTDAMLGSNLSASMSPSDTFMPVSGANGGSSAGGVDLDGFGQSSASVGAPLVDPATDLDASSDFSSGTDLDSVGSMDNSDLGTTSWASPMSAEGEWSSGWVMTGSHSSDQPTAEDRYFQSRA